KKYGWDNFDKEILVDQVLIDKEIVNMHQKRLTELYKDLPEQEKIAKMDVALRDVILKDNFFNKIMEFIVPYYEFEIDPKEVKTQAESLKKNFPERDQDVLNQIAERSIQKRLIFNDLEKQFKLTLTPEEIDKNLTYSADQLGQNLEEIKKDQARYDVLKELLQEEYIIAFLLNKFPLRVNLPYD
ncbi:hypothetical protein IKS57_00015, partial [bacterium]|nr:hypothetical protein [bacterium]